MELNRYYYKNIKYHSISLPLLFWMKADTFSVLVSSVVCLDAAERK